MPRSSSRSYGRKRSYSRSPKYTSRRRSPRSRSRPLDPFQTENQIYVARFHRRRTTEGDLRRAFEEFGRIQKIDLKEGRGFGFIYFDRKSDALDAIERMNNRRLPGTDERIVVEKAGLDRKGRGPRRRSRRRSGSGNRIPRGEGNDLCYNCNEEGHYARDCKNSPRPRRGRERNDGRCFHCSERGHIKAHCPKLGRSRSRSQRRSPYRRGRSQGRRSVSRDRRRKRYSSSRGSYRRRTSSRRSRSPRDVRRRSRSMSGRRSRGRNHSERRSRSRSLRRSFTPSRSRSPRRSRSFHRSRSPRRSHSPRKSRSPVRSKSPRRTESPRSPRLSQNSQGRRTPPREDDKPAANKAGDKKEAVESEQTDATTEAQVGNSQKARGEEVK